MARRCAAEPSHPSALCPVASWANGVVVELTLCLADKAFGLHHDVVGQATLFSDLEHTHERLAIDTYTLAIALNVASL